MSDWVELYLLELSAARPSHFIPTPSPSLRKRVQAFGVVDPIPVRPLGDGRYEILSNPEAWVAAGKAGLEHVPVVIRDDLTESEAADIVREHYATLKLNPIDEAEEFASQVEALGGKRRYGVISKVAAMAGLPRPYVAHALRLLELPHKIKEQVRAGHLTAGHARPLVTIPQRADQLHAANAIIQQNLTVRAAEALAAQLKAEGEGADENGAVPPPSTGSRGEEKSPDIRQLEDAVSDLIGSRFEIRGDEAVIHYYGDLDILEGVLTRLGYRTDQS